MSNYNNHSNSNNSKESVSNPFGEFDDEEDTPNQNGGGGYMASPPREDSEEEAKSVQDSYLNIRVRALYDYKSSEDDELSFAAGKLN